MFVPDEPAFSLDGSRHLPVTSSSYLPSSSVTESHTTGSGRHVRPLLKKAQTTALNRLLQQRATRPPGPVTEATNSEPATSSGPTNVSHGRARKSTTRGNLSSMPRGGSTSRRGTSDSNRTANVSNRKRNRPASSRRGSATRLTDDSESSRGSCFSSEMSCVSASDEASHEDPESESEVDIDEDDDDDSVDSMSSDDRWSPSRHSRVNLVVDVRRGRVRRKHIHSIVQLFTDSRIRYVAAYNAVYLSPAARVLAVCSLSRHMRLRSEELQSYDQPVN
ncbi:unnamed protein product [Echinostoma caproni]|uniref:SOCS box domain-containing protein n=1 Tax=Echinostoma caproni TaxID=27848 RepID=A0A183AE92_9TREM|nr:unnamed protein product [Echinostoma caproni]